MDRECSAHSAPWVMGRWEDAIRYQACTPRTADEIRPGKIRGIGTGGPLLAATPAAYWNVLYGALSQTRPFIAFQRAVLRLPFEPCVFLFLCPLSCNSTSGYSVVGNPVLHDLYYQLDNFLPCYQRHVSDRGSDKRGHRSGSLIDWA